MKKLLLLTAALVATCMFARAQEVCDIENEGTRKFLEEVDYSADVDPLSAEEIELLRKYLIVKD